MNLMNCRDVVADFDRQEQSDHHCPHLGVERSQIVDVPVVVAAEAKTVVCHRGGNGGDSLKDWLAGREFSFRESTRCGENQTGNREFVPDVSLLIRSFGSARYP